MPRNKANSKPIDFENTALWLDCGLDVATRTVRMFGDVDEELLLHMTKSLHILENHDPNQPITILLNTTGGCEVSGLAIYDLLRRMNCEVTIKVVGQAWSMGAIILQAAHRRVMLPNSSLMIHVGDREYSGHSENVRREMLFDKEIDATCDKILLERMEIFNPELTMGKFRDILTLDTYYSAKEAVRVGLADEVEP